MQNCSKLQVFGALFRGVALKVNDWSMLFRGEDSPNHKPPSNRDEVTTASVVMKFIQRSGILCEVVFQKTKNHSFSKKQTLLMAHSAESHV